MASAVAANSRRHAGQPLRWPRARARSSPAATPAASSGNRSRASAHSSPSATAHPKRLTELGNSPADPRLGGAERNALQVRGLLGGQAVDHEQDDQPDLLWRKRVERAPEVLLVLDVGTPGFAFFARQQRFRER